MTMIERQLLVDGEWIETGDWIEVRSPYSGDVVGRVAEGGRRRDAPRGRRGRARAREPAAGARARGASSTASPDLLAGAAGGGRRARSAPRPASRSRRRASRPQRAASTYTFAAVEARKLAGEMIPMDASAAGAGKLAFTLRRADRDRRRDLAVQLPAQPGRAQDRAGARRRLPGRAQAREPDAALGAPARRAARRRPGCPPAGSTSSPGPPRAIGDVLVEDERVKLITFTGSGGVGWGLARARAAQARQARARQRDPGDRAGGRRRRGGRRQARRERLLLRRPELHLGAADLRRARRPATTSSPTSCRRSRRSWSATRPTRRPTSAR